MNLPCFLVYSKGTVPCREDYLGLCLELSLLTPSQYINYNFDSMCKFGDVYLGCNSSGIFELGGNKDELTDIDAFFELVTTDFGITNQKRIRKAYLGYEASGSLVLEVRDDEDNVRRYILPALLEDQRQHGASIPIGRNGKGKYWTFKLENVGGCDFSVDSLDALVTILSKKPGKTMNNKGKIILPTLEVYGKDS